MPELYQYLRVLADLPDCKACFLLSSSSSTEMVGEISKRLAEKIGFVDMSGFNLEETALNNCRELWVRGDFPRSFLAPSPVRVPDGELIIHRHFWKRIFSFPDAIFQRNRSGNSGQCLPTITDRSGAQLNLQDL
ncbi:hypothetical protein CSA37_08060 [Candidatus Fermentibacteria bacterium]|nr:MAG: hypothetical protein CSA37_08060 [Candidatus Fermentibacteria bacterium]